MGSAEFESAYMSDKNMSLVKQMLQSKIVLGKALDDLLLIIYVSLNKVYVFKHSCQSFVQTCVNKEERDVVSAPKRSLNSDQKAYLHKVYVQKQTPLYTASRLRNLKGQEIGFKIIIYCCLSLHYWRMFPRGNIVK